MQSRWPSTPTRRLVDTRWSPSQPLSTRKRAHQDPVPALLSQLSPPSPSRSIDTERKQGQATAKISGASQDEQRTRRHAHTRKSQARRKRNQLISCRLQQQRERVWVCASRRLGRSHTAVLVRTEAQVLDILGRRTRVRVRVRVPVRLNQHANTPAQQDHKIIAHLIAHLLAYGWMLGEHTLVVNGDSVADQAQSQRLEGSSPHGA